MFRVGMVVSLGWTIIYAFILILLKSCGCRKIYDHKEEIPSAAETVE